MTAASPTAVQLAAPVTGLLVPIEHVPDPVFAQKMVGEGISIDPLDHFLVAPIAGEVIDVQPSGHAVTIRSAEGLEVLMHIGLDTVKMQGAGFDPQVREGQTVAVGDVLVDFDLDQVATGAKSLLTQMVIANSDVIASLTPRTGQVRAGQDVVADIVLGDASSEGAATVGGRTVSSEGILVPNPTGLHARPSATLVALAKGYESQVRIRRGEDVANAKSIMAIMGLAVERGQKVVVTAHGSDADDAVAAIGQAIRDGLGEDCPPIAPGGDDTSAVPALTPDAMAAAQEVFRQEQRALDPNVMLGVAASPGLGIGTVLQVRHEDITVAEYGADHHTERRKLNSAIDRALLDLSALHDRLAAEADRERAEIFAAHQ